MPGNVGGIGFMLAGLACVGVDMLFVAAHANRSSAPVSDERRQLYWSPKERWIWLSAWAVLGAGLVRLRPDGAALCARCVRRRSGRSPARRPQHLDTGSHWHWGRLPPAWLVGGGECAPAQALRSPGLP